MSESVPSNSGTLLGSFDVTLRVDPGSGTSGLEIRATSVSDRVGRELALVVSSLLFVQRQIRSIGDSARFATIASLNAACVSARDGHVVKPAISRGARVAATYRVDLLAEGSFQINVDQKLDGILEDSAGSLSASAMALEILTTCAEPHKSFFRQMLEAATSYWRVRRPSATESTWDWAVALRQLDQLARGNTDPFAPTQMCESCGAVRPIGSSCLRCGAASTVVQPGSVVSPSSQPDATTIVSPPAVPAFELPMSPAPSPVAPSGGYVGVTGQPVPKAEVRSEIIKATDVDRESQGGVAPPAVEGEAWALAGLTRRFAALVLDVLSGVLLAVVGSFGFIQILASTGGVAPEDDPRPLTIIVFLGIFLLYLALGWSKGETLGMLVTRTRLLRPDDRKPAGLARAFMRAVGAYVTFGLGLIAFGIITVINLNLTFIQGTADLIIRIAAVVVGLYVVWLASGQRIVAGPSRQSLSDRIAGTIVAIRG